MPLWLTRPKVGESGLTTINKSFYLSSGIAAVASIVLAFIYLPGSFEDLTDVSGTGSLLARILGDNATASGDPRIIASVAVLSIRFLSPVSSAPSIAPATDRA